MTRCFKPVVRHAIPSSLLTHGWIVWIEEDGKLCFVQILWVFDRRSLLDPVGVVQQDAEIANSPDAGFRAHRGLACLDARMGEIYWGCFRPHDQRLLIACGTPAVGPAAGIALPFGGPLHGIGRGFAAYPVLQAIPGIILAPGAVDALPDVRDVARLGAMRLQAGEGIDPSDLTPLYVRDKVALTEAERSVTG